MKQSFWGYFVVLCGVVIIIILLLVQRMTSTSEEDFYLAREVMESSMVDAVDYGTYRTTGRLVMSEQKFVEVFIRRFAESVTNNKTYELDFYDIYEEPPKASVKVRTSSGGSANIKDTSFDVNLDTLVSGILETLYSQSDGNNSDGGKGGDTGVVTCPDGRKTTIKYTPNIPDGSDDDDDDNSGGNNNRNDETLVTSGILNFYSIGYLANSGAYNTSSKTCNNKSTSGGMDYVMEFNQLPNGSGQSISGGKIRSCEVINGSIKAFDSKDDITKFKNFRQSMSKYMVNSITGLTDSSVNEFKYYATSSELSNITVGCNVIGGYDDNGNESGTVQIRVTYNSKSNNRSTANGNIVARAITDKKTEDTCIMYTGVKWNIRFKYAR